MEEERFDINERITLRYMEELKHSAAESDRGLVIFSAAQVDLYLRRIIEAFLVKDKGVAELFNGPFAPFSSVSGKTRAAFFLGLISKLEAERIDAVWPAAGLVDTTLS